MWLQFPFRTIRHKPSKYLNLPFIARARVSYRRVGGAAFPTAPHRERSEHLQPQPDHDRSAVLFRVTLRRHDLAAEGLAHQGTAKAAASVEPRRGQACSDHGDEPAGASDADTRLRLRTEGGRGGAAAGGRHRQ